MISLLFLFGNDCTEKASGIDIPTTYRVKFKLTFNKRLIISSFDIE